jgi:hypothetical protein
MDARLAYCAASQLTWAEIVKSDMSRQYNKIEKRRRRRRYLQRKRDALKASAGGSKAPAPAAS